MSFLDECIDFTGAVWDRYVHHAWIEALFAGELSEGRFQAAKWAGIWLTLSQSTANGLPTLPTFPAMASRPAR